MTESDLDQLEQYVNAPERIEAALPLDAIQGLVAAVASGPGPVPSSRWIAAALGEQHKFATPDDEARITGLLVRFHDEVARQLNEGEGFDFLLYGPEGEEEDFSVWADGYLMGVDLADPPWDDSAGSEDLDPILFPFFALTGQAREMALEQGEDWMSEAEERRMMKEVREGFADHLIEVRRFWFDKSVAPTVKREAPKTGRNDPCPCGSGKKHKSCCGR